MRLTRFLAAALCVAFMMGCATAPGRLRTVISAEPGEYHEVLLDVRAPSEGSASATVAVHFDKLQPSDQWAPVIALCLQGADPIQARACLHLSAMPDGKVMVTRFERLSAKDSRPSRQWLPHSYGSHDALKVRVDFGLERAAFYIDGVPIFESDALERPERLVLSCSSAVCQLDVLD
jgi:hypothetical protein